MLAPPNAGSEVVDHLMDFPPFRWITSVNGPRLGTGAIRSRAPSGRGPARRAASASSRATARSTRFSMHGCRVRTTARSPSRTRGSTAWVILSCCTIPTPGWPARRNAGAGESIPAHWKVFPLLAPALAVAAEVTKLISLLGKLGTLIFADQPPDGSDQRRLACGLAFQKFQAQTTTVARVPSEATSDITRMDANFDHNRSALRQARVRNSELLIRVYSRDSRAFLRSVRSSAAASGKPGRWPA